MAKKFNSVSDLLKGIGEKELAKNIKDTSGKKTISSTLFKLRNSAGLTQKELAGKAKVRQSTISKIEHAYDKNIKMNDLALYSHALGMNLNLAFTTQKDITLAELLEYKIREMDKILEKLRTLAKGDEEIIAGLTKFHDSTEKAFNKLLKENLSNLQGMKKSKKEQEITIHTPVEINKINKAPA